MESLLSAFGIDAKLITIQIINFVVLAVALSYLLYKPILKILDEREAKIKKGIEDAEAATAARAAAEDDRKAILEAAHHDAAEVSTRAKSRAKEDAAHIVHDAEEKAANILATANVRGEEIKVRAHEESEAEIAKLTILAAEKIIRKQL